MHIAADTASQPHIHRAGGTDGLKHRRLHLTGIRRHDHPHIGQRPHDGDIFDGLVGSAVLTYADTAMGGDDLHIHLGIADGVPDLLKGLLRGKHSIGRPDDRMSKGGNARRDAHRISLRDAHGIESLRPPLLKLDASGGFRHIRSHNDQLGKLLACRDKRLSEFISKISAHDITPSFLIK